MQRLFNQLENKPGLAAIRRLQLNSFRFEMTMQYQCNFYPVQRH